MNDQLLIGGIIALAILVIIQFFLIFTLRKRMSDLMRGRDGSSLEDLIQDALHIIDSLQHSHSLTKKQQKYLEKKLKHCIQTPSTVRFNPFSDAGSNQSFATSFINENGNGVIVSSLYAQGKTSIFAKPINGFQSDYELTSEEDHVLQQAKNQVL